MFAVGDELRVAESLNLPQCIAYQVACKAVRSNILHRHTDLS